MENFEFLQGIGYGDDTWGIVYEALLVPDYTKTYEIEMDVDDEVSLYLSKLRVELGVCLGDCLFLWF